MKIKYGLTHLVFLLVASPVLAQGTRLWTQSTYEEFEKGTSQNIAIRSDGRLEIAPLTNLVYTAPSNYIWSLASDSAGNAYLGTGSVSGSPSTVLKVTPDGKSTKLFDAKELAMQALRVGPDGALYAASSPDGKVYRIPLNAPATTPAIVFDPAQTTEKPKYIWDLAFDKSGNLYIATGAPAAIYRVAARADAKPELFFKSDDQHVRCLLFSADGTLYAGTDGAGVIYKITDGKAFALYSASKREITALALDAAGNLYAAGLGAKTASTLPPLSVQGNAISSITFLQPGSATAANANSLVPDGSDLYRIAPDGTPQKLLTLHDDVVYALTIRENSLLAITGNRGHVYSISLDKSEPTGRFTDLTHLDASQGIAVAPAKSGLFIATSNTGKLFTLSDTPAPEATYTSEVYDAQVFSQWGRPEILADKIDLYLRTGNVENPHAGSSSMWSDWQHVSANSTSVPNARYVQWKAVLHSGGMLNSVSLNYLPRNIAPVVDDILVQPGARMNASNTAQTPGTVQIAFPTPAATTAFPFPMDTSTSAPLTAQKDKTAITVRWAAHDDNGDDLLFALYFRGDGETNWHLLKDKITDRFYSFDSALLPDGGYTIKVIASDAPSHTASDALTGERQSTRFIVDTTPPVLTSLQASTQQKTIHASFDATDATSPIARAEYSLDAGPWQYLEPANKISDSQTEHYDFTVTIPETQPNTPAPANPAEHVLAVRVYDRYDNMSSVKAIVK